MQEGVKYDEAKPRPSLLPWREVLVVVDVLEHGAKTYSVGNWQRVPDARTRYFDAAHRHLAAWWLGERNDPDSGLPHLAHAAATLLFLMWFDAEAHDAPGG